MYIVEWHQRDGTGTIISSVIYKEEKTDGGKLKGKHTRWEVPRRHQPITMGGPDLQILNQKTKNWKQSL